MTSYITLLLLQYFAATIPSITAPNDAATVMSVDAGPDILICEPGETVTLVATTSPDVVYLEWSPAQFLGTPFSNATSATVPITTTFTVTVGTPSTTNLFVNGDFADDDFDSYFTTQYNPDGQGTNVDQGPLTEPAQLAISNDANSQNTDFINFPDLTGEGNMLVVNGHIQGLQNILCQTIPVVPGSHYQLTAYAATVVDRAPPFIRATINNIAVGQAMIPIGPGVWQPITGVWSSGASTSATICFQDLNTEWNGNDFVMDNITFSPLIMDFDQVTVSVMPLDASISLPDSMCVTEFPLNLDDYLEPSADVGGFWYVNGDPSFDFNPLTLGEGVHTVTYSVEVFPCMEESSETIVVTPPPNADWIGPEMVCDSDDPIDMDDWLTDDAEPDGTWNINGLPATEFDPGDLGVGLHEVIYTAGDIATGCTNDAIDTIEVLPQPIASWDVPAPLCADDEPLILDSLLNPEATTGGTWIVNGIDTAIIYPGDLNPAEYVVSYTVSNPVCDSTQIDTILVVGALSSAISLPADSFCVGDIATLNFDGTSNDTTIFHWDFDGIVATPDTGMGPLSLDFSTAGNYNISLWLEEASCTSDTSILTVDVIPPLATPMPECTVLGNSSLSFSWPSIPGADSYSVDVISGQSGSTPNDTTYTLTGLSPGESVQIVVTATGNMPCPAVMSDTISCATLDCTPPLVEIDSIAPICFDAATLMPFTLNVTTAPTGGIGAWSGLGITDTNTGVFDPIEAGIGTHVITYTYEVDNCTGMDTIHINLLPIPQASFNLIDSVCINDTIGIQFTGVTNTGSPIFNWNFDGGDNLDAPESTIQNVSWNTDGEKIISLQITENGCTSPIYRDTITVVAPLAPPVIECATTENTVNFFWNAQEDVSSYTVVVINGPTGVMTSDTSYFFDNLMPEDTVGIQVISHSATACPDIVTEQSCIAAACPEITVSIDPVADICLVGMDAPFPLVATVSDGDNTGSFQWSGTGITDAANGIFSPQDANIGDNNISLIYQRGSCFYNASIQIAVYNTPTAVFAATPDTICVLNETTISYEGNASSSATYNWDWGTANAVPGTGQGPHQVSWPQAGTHTISLWVSENGCVSDTLSQEIVVEPTLEAIAVNCEATYSSVLFSWSPVANVDSFVVQTINGGPAGNMLSDTSYLIDGLQAEQEVSISIEAFSSNSCPNYQIEESCTTLACPDVILEVDDLSAQCYDNISDTLAISYTLSGNQNSGTLSWSGAGVIDPDTALWVTDASQVGQNNLLIATWVDDVCTVSDTITIELNATPVAAFNADAIICEIDTANVSFTGTINTATPTFNWDFDGGTIITGTGEGPYQIEWDAPGDYTISLFVEENGCVSDTVDTIINVEPVLEEVQINCQVTTTSVTFIWNTISNASSYQVDVLSAHTGTMTSDTSYLVENLDPDEAVDIQVTAISSNSCPSVSVQQSCAASNCPPVTVDIQAIADHCYSGVADTIPLQAQLSGDNGNGMLVWSGAGIFDATQGLWETDISQANQSNEVIATWIDGVCVVADTAYFNLYETPIADFVAPDTICIIDTALISYTGSPASVDSYNWNFDGATIISGTDAGPYQLQWDAVGNYTIEAWVEHNGCPSDTVSMSVQVDPTLEPIVANCDADYSSVLITWDPIANATGYIVTPASGTPTGTMLADTAYLIENLLPETTIEIEISALSANACPNISTIVNCTTLPCPDLTLDIQLPTQQCIGAQADTIDLQLNIIGDPSNGDLNWQGDGIINPDTGLWVTNLSQVGPNNQVIVTWTEDVCVVSDTLIFDLYEIPSAAFSIDPNICVQDEATATYTGNASSSATYNWDFDGATVVSGTGEGPYQLQWGTAGTYTISLEVIENGCVSETVQENIIVDPTLSPLNIDCEAFLESVIFTWTSVDNATGYEVEVLNGLPDGTFLNDTTYQVGNLMPNQMASIIVTATSNNTCPDVMAEASCITSECPNVLVDLEATPAICQGEDSQLTISFAGDESGPYNITYTVGGMSVTLNNVTADQVIPFTLDITTNFAITNIENLGAPACTVNLPPATSTTVDVPVSAGTYSGPVTVCSRTDTIIQLSDLLEDETAGGSWTYLNGPTLEAGSFDMNAGTFNPQLQTPGTYTFQYLVAGPGTCPDASTQVQVIIEERPSADPGDATTLSCAQNEATLGGPGTSQGANIIYSWTSANGFPISNPTAANITVSQPDTYTLLVSNTSNNCTESASVIVDLDESFLLPFGSLTDISCFAANDGTISIDSVDGGTPPYLYGINDGPLSSSPLFSNLTPGNYEIMVEDAAGCQSTISFDLLEPGELTAQLSTNFEGSDNEIVLGESLTLTANVSVPESEIDAIIWQPDTLACDSCFTTTVTPTQSTLFSITVIDANGCSAFDELSVIVRKDEGIYIPNIFSPNGDGRNDLFTIYTGVQVSKIISFHIFDRWGEQVHYRDNSPPNDPTLAWDGTFKGSLLNPNVFVYFAEVELVDGSTVTVSGEVLLMR